MKNALSSACLLNNRDRLGQETVLGHHLQLGLSTLKEVIKDKSAIQNTFHDNDSTKPGRHEQHGLSGSDSLKKIRISLSSFWFQSPTVLTLARRWSIN